MRVNDTMIKKAEQSAIDSNDMDLLHKILMTVLNSTVIWRENA